MSEAQREELFSYITYHAQYSMALSIVQCKRALVMIMLENAGILDGVQDISEAEARLDLYADLWDVDKVWRNFRDWVRTTKSEQDWLSVRRLFPSCLKCIHFDASYNSCTRTPCKPSYFWNTALRKSRPVQDVSMCTEAVVSQAVQNLLALLQETGIADEDGVIREPERLFATDEKGLSERSDSVSRGVVARHQARRASALTGSTTFEHITLTSFAPLSGRRYPVGVIVSTSREHDTWKNLEGLEVRANRGGGTTSALFAEFTKVCMAKPAREHIAPDKPLVLLLDSGGGSWVHLSGAFLRTCLQANVKPFFLPAWTTKAMMPCDMNIHETMARLWREFKQAWGLKRLPLTIFVGLKAAAEICDTALQADVVRASWAQIGIRAQQKYDHNKIFVERKDECCTNPQSPKVF